MDNEAIHDLFESVRPVTIRRMFGGKGIYRDGVIVALEVGGEILLKADEQTAPAFRGAGSRQWIYEKRSANNRPVAMPYWSIPEEAIDDPYELAKWVKLACEAGMRAR